MFVVLFCLTKVYQLSMFELNKSSQLSIQQMTIQKSKKTARQQHKTINDKIDPLNFLNLFYEYFSII